jgi:hypothetical protein
MTSLRRAPANKILAAQLVKLRQELRLRHKPRFVFCYYLRARAVFADHERIAPYGRTPDIDGVDGRAAQILFVQNANIVFHFNVRKSKV